MALFRLGMVADLLRQHLPLPHGPALQDIVTKVGEEVLTQAGDAAADAAREMAEPDPANSSWLWDRDPFEPGIQLTSDPLTADISGSLDAADLSLPDLADGIDTTFG